MTLHELGGLLELNALYVAAGLGLLWLVCPRGAPIGRIYAAAHLIGFAVVSVVSVFLLTSLEVRPTPLIVLAVASLAVAGGAWRRGVTVRAFHDPQPAARCDLLTAATFSVAAFMAVHAFRLAYSQGLAAWDAWSFWTPKALAIDYHGLDSAAFAAVAAKTYPLLVPASDVAVFGFSGSTDVVPLSVQFVALAFGFVAAAWAIGTRLGARSWLVWLFLTLFLTLPAGLGRLLAPQGDFVMDYLFAAGIGFVVLWLTEEQGWALVLATVLWSGAAASKREGIAFVLAGAVAVVAMSGLRRSRLLGAGALLAVPLLTMLPWWVWLRTHHIHAESPAPLTQGGGPATRIASHYHLLPAALGAVMRATFSTPWWGGAAIAGAVAVAAGLAVPATRRSAGVVAVTSLLITVVIVWRLLWGDVGGGTEFESAAFPTRRLVGALILMWLVLAPGYVSGAVARLRMPRLPRLPVAVALIPALALVLVAWHRGDFRSVHPECSLTGIPGPFGVALGPVEPYADAIRLQRRVQALGFQHTVIATDTCAGATAVTPLLPSLSVAQSVVAEARSAHLDPYILTLPGSP